MGVPFHTELGMPVPDLIPILLTTMDVVCGHYVFHIYLERYGK
jgi:hypothetical protein